ncbi:hypothetical protein [Maridesulfovibrio sp. FT414]|uniref:hypothetical protein n=1 Tax=Maridesulfovibrio sp. FT414 TaxID=2979469 RepID=UPI003D80A2D0
MSVSIKGKSSFAVKKQAKLLAEKQAITNYLKRVSPAAGSQCEQQLIDDRAALIQRISPQGISQVGDSVEASYLVRIDDEKFNYRLEELGCGSQSGAAEVVILIMEEPPTAGDIAMILNDADASGTRELRGLGPFVLYYTSYQRAIRDAIISKANMEGLKLTRLDTVDDFQKMKMSHDDPMVGVYFDTENEDFALNQRLIKEVKRKFAGKSTIILYYRIASLYFDQVQRELKAAIAISMHDLDTGETKSVGEQDFMVMIPEGQPGPAIRDGLSEVASNAASLLMNRAKKEARRMSSIAQKRAQTQNKSADLTTVNLKLSSKRNMYKVMKALSPASVKDSGMQGEELVIHLTSGTSAEDFVFVELLGLIEGMGISIPDQNIQFNDKQVTIRQ